MTFFPLMILFLLLAGHAWADFAAQSDYVANAKNRNTTLGKGIWPMVLGAHALIHGATTGVILLGGSLLLGVQPEVAAFIALSLGMLEAISHATVDFLKCDKHIGYKTDQALHVMFKLIWFTSWVLCLGKVSHV